MKQKFTLFLLFATILANAQQKPSQQWLDQKYSMFIHFGLYSVYGGVYNGQPVRRGYSEQIQSHGGIFSDWYANTAREFNPVEWNPDEIVKLAKDAGMRSIVFTSKHHDGFCMYHSRYTRYNIVDATPYKRDLMKELADACRRGGIEFSVYYSLIDWNFPHAYPISSHNADPLTEEHYRFNLKQVEEIMTNYGDISEIWFDMGSLTPEQSRGLYELVNRLQPQCMISGRLGNDYVDFAVMADNEYPDYKLEVPWQTAASIFHETWGYRSWQKRGEVKPKVEEKISSLVKVICRGGNYLLNIGPRGDGSVVKFERDVLQGVGKWVKQNAEAIYGTKATPFDKPFAWGNVTMKGNDLFAFVEDLPASQQIELQRVTGKVSEVRLLASGELCNFSQKGGVIKVELPKKSSEEFIPVIRIRFENGFTVTPSIIVTGNRLSPQNAVPLFGHSSLNYYGGYKSLIGYDWKVSRSKGKVFPKLLYTDSERGRSIDIEIDGRRQHIVLDGSNPTTVKLEKSRVKWGNLYRKPGKGVFGYVEEEGLPLVNVGAAGSGWKPVIGFRYGEIYTEAIQLRESILFLQEIESEKEQTIAVELGSGNGVYVLLNGAYITAHLSPQKVKYGKEVLLLPLRKGLNQLIIKQYNGYEEELAYSLQPLDEWTIYSLQLPETRITQSVSVRAADAESKVAPLRMNNLMIIR
ncbi:alpha-L-fucosidase [Petrimonas mucosa]|uniref:alpha-L-fucosidase n=1 Tax=Petrimonas mucosa TaxID=1642646 RepID=A0A1G4G3N4_9BACT|nr:alpha-L-fucosidase [Petrimonas mucosa]SCM55387.1 putative alpha-L-fucosidase [Petrimonas mucosa]